MSIIKVIGFDCLNHEYSTYQNFGNIYISLACDPPATVNGFTSVDVSYFKESIYTFPILSFVTTSLGDAYERYCYTLIIITPYLGAK